MLLKTIKVNIYIYIHKCKYGKEECIGIIVVGLKKKRIKFKGYNPF